MKAFSPFKIQTGVVALSIALIVPETGTSQITIEGGLLNGRAKPYCHSLLDKIEAAHKEFKNACTASRVPKSVCDDPTTLPNCVEKREELDEFLMGEDGEDRSHYEDCEKLKDFIQAGCTAFLPDADEARRDYSEYRRELRDLQRERDRAKKDADEKRKDMQDQLYKLDEDAFKEDKEWQERRRELNDEIQKEISQVESQKTQAWADTRRKLDEIEVAYMDYQRKVRELQTNIGVMNAQWEIQCRVVADAEAKQTEKEFEARLQAENQIVKNYSFSTAARKLKNEMKKKRRKVTSKYNEVFARCMKGEINPGAEIRARILQAEVQTANETADANNRVARLERLKKESIESLQALIKSLEEQKAQRVMSLQQSIAELDRNHQVRSNQIAMQKMQLMAEMQTQLANASKEMGNISEQLEDFRRERIRKSALAKCNLPGREEKAEARKGFNNLTGAFEALQSFCSGYKQSDCAGAPVDENSSGKLGYPPVCRKFDQVSTSRASGSVITPPRTTSSTTSTSGSTSSQTIIYGDSEPTLPKSGTNLAQ